MNKLFVRREPPVISHASSRAESQGPGVRGSMNRQRLLIVDDEPRNVRLLEGMLYGEPYELIPAHSGAEALDLIGKNPPDLVLLDVMMPDINGFEVCKHIKSDPNRRMIPVVMVTALSDVSDRIEAMQAGADDFLSKPIDAAELIVRVRSLVRVRQLYAEVERVTAQRLAVMAGIAHDIRSPLNALMLSVELLADRLPKDERLVPLWTNITACTEQIRMLSNDLMRYYQIEAGKFQLTYTRCELASLIDPAMAVATPIANEKGLRLLIDAVPELTLDADQSAVTQVLLNLLTNAIKYTDTGGQVRLSLHNLAQGGYTLPPDHYPPVLTLPSQGVVIEIADTGRGIAPQDFERVFTEFDRLKASQSETEGVGLGLPVSQRLVRLHGGEIWFTSAVDHGSTFAFFLPSDQKRRMNTSA
jgi:two-component system sensor histidine kinase/response regulator